MKDEPERNLTFNDKVDIALFVVGLIAISLFAYHMIFHAN